MKGLNELLNLQQERQKQLQLLSFANKFCERFIIVELTKTPGDIDYKTRLRLISNTKKIEIDLFLYFYYTLGHARYTRISNNFGIVY